MSMTLANKVVLITGAGSGIGRSAAIHFARQGWKVGLVGRGAQALAAARLDVEAAGGMAATAQADVSDGAALERAAVAIEMALGPIDVWVNNAGTGFFGKFTDMSNEEFRRVMEVNFFGTVNGTRIALSRMRPRNAGTIVQILSAIGYRGVPLQSAYSSSKYALRGFNEALRAELINERSAVHVTMVHPPAVNTPFYSHAGSRMDAVPRPPPPVYQPEMIGEAVYIAATSRQREWKVSGSTLGFAIGNKVAPGVLDYLAGTIGVRAQQTRRKSVKDVRDVTLFAPSSKPASTHGPFDRESLATSVQWWVDKSPPAVRFGLGVLAIGMLAAARRRR